MTTILQSHVTQLSLKHPNFVVRNYFTFNTPEICLRYNDIEI